MARKHSTRAASELLTLADGHRLACELLDDIQDNVTACCLLTSDRCLMTRKRKQSKKFWTAVDALYRRGTEDAKQGFFSVMEDFVAHTVEPDAATFYATMAAEERGAIVPYGEVGHGIH